jgi:hypothetical protein
LFRSLFTNAEQLIHSQNPQAIKHVLSLHASCCPMRIERSARASSETMKIVKPLPALNERTIECANDQAKAARRLVKPG